MSLFSSSCSPEDDLPPSGCFLRWGKGCPPAGRILYLSSVKMLSLLGNGKRIPFTGFFIDKSKCGSETRLNGDGQSGIWNTLIEFVESHFRMLNKMLLLLLKGKTVFYINIFHFVIEDGD